MSERLPVVAAIPNYNMGAQLPAVLSILAMKNYDDIYVLDDASTDDSREVVESFNSGSGVCFISSPENKGAGATRNLITQSLGQKSLIHFLDADVLPITPDMPEAVRDMTPAEPVGFIGGLTLTDGGMQSIWNYGPHQDYRAFLGAQVQARLEPMLIKYPDKANELRQRFSNLMADWPNPLVEPMRREIFWNIEANLVVQSDVFATIGGFDEKLREHEIQDLAIRLHKKGLKRFFDPSVVVLQTDNQNVREYNRLPAMARAEAYIAHKHGLRNWFLPGKRFKVES